MTMEVAGLLPLEYGERCFRDVVIALRDDTDPDHINRKFCIEKIIRRICPCITSFSFLSAAKVMIGRCAYGIVRVTGNAPN